MSATRLADVYVFCVHAEQEKAKANVLDVSSCEFYVASTETLNKKCAAAKPVSMPVLKRMAVACTFDTLKAAVDGVLMERQSVSLSGVRRR